MVVVDGTDNLCVSHHFQVLRHLHPAFYVDVGLDFNVLEYCLVRYEGLGSGDDLVSVNGHKRVHKLLDVDSSRCVNLLTLQPTKAISVDLKSQGVDPRGVASHTPWTIHTIDLQDVKFGLGVED